MKRLSLIAALTLSTMLSACGGGGGHGGHIPTTTLPDTPNNPSTNTCSANPETCMTTQKFSNAAKREELYENARNSGTQQRKVRRKAYSMNRSVDGFADVDTAYKTMKDILIDGNTANSSDDLRHSLLLAGFSAEDLPNDDLENWAEINSLTIKDKAQKIWDMYGEKKDVDMANAKLNSVDIKSTKQDSFVNFLVNDNGKITGLQFDVETDSSGNRTMIFQKDGDGKFTRTGDLYVMQFPMSKNVDGRSSTLELELLEDVTADNIDTVKKKLIAKLYEHKSEHNELDETIFSDTLKNIEDLNFETFSKMKEELKDNGFYFGGKRTTVINYASKAKDIGEKGLQYSDFGLITLSGEQANGTMEQPEYSVFAGGYEVKRIDASKFATQTMEFDGKAVASVEYQKEQENVENRESKSERFDGTAHLLFDGRNETLTAKFDKWYDVEVKSNDNKDNYDITYTNGGRIENPLFKFNGGDEFETKDFVGNYQIEGQGERYGSADLGYYGDNNNPTEATGYITYGEEMSDNQGGADSLHMQIGFGTQRTK